MKNEDLEVNNLYMAMHEKTGRPFIDPDNNAYVFFNEEEAKRLAENYGGIRLDGPRFFTYKEICTTCYAAGALSLKVRGPQKGSEECIPLSKLEKKKYYNPELNRNLNLLHETHRKEYLRAIISNTFIVPVKINEEDDKGVIIEYSVAVIKDREYFLAFSDIDEYSIWASKVDGYSPLEITFKELRSLCRTDDCIINVFGSRYVLTQEKMFLIDGNESYLIKRKEEDKKREEERLRKEEETPPETEENIETEKKAETKETEEKTEKKSKPKKKKKEKVETEEKEVAEDNLPFADDNKEKEEKPKRDRKKKTEEVAKETIEEENSKDDNKEESSKPKKTHSRKKTEEKTEDSEESSELLFADNNKEKKAAKKKEPEREPEVLPGSPFDTEESLGAEDSPFDDGGDDPFDNDGDDPFGDGDDLSFGDEMPYVAPDYDDIDMDDDEDMMLFGDDADDEDDEE